VRPFRREKDDTFSGRFEAGQVAVLLDLTEQVSELLSGSDDVSPGTSSARALDRLLPNAYPDDSEAAAEFRRFTREGLVDRKLANAQAVRSTLDAGTPTRSGVAVSLDERDAQAWLRCLTDLRLTLATALGIEDEGDDRFVGDIDRYALTVYHWLGIAQESLVRALDR
jgi:hypothetical protein